MTLSKRIDNSNYTSTLTDGLPSARVSVLHAADRGVQGAHGQRVCASNPAPTRSSCFDGQSGCRVSSVGSRLVLAHTPGLAMVLPATGFGRCARPLSNPSFLHSGSLPRCCIRASYTSIPSFPERPLRPLFGAPKAVASPFLEGDGRGSLL